MRHVDANGVGTVPEEAGAGHLIHNDTHHGRGIGFELPDRSPESLGMEQGSRRRHVEAANFRHDAFPWQASASTGITDGTEQPIDDVEINEVRERIGEIHTSDPRPFSPPRTSASDRSQGRQIRPSSWLLGASQMTEEPARIGIGLSAEANEVPLVSFLRSLLARRNIRNQMA